MARALECPACGARHRLDSIPEGSTFRCERCNQVLKVPDVIAASREPARGSTPARPRGGAPAPPPRRRGAPVPPSAPMVTASTTVPATASSASADIGPPARGGAPGDVPSGTASRARPPREKARLYWRIVAWVIAVPLGFVITALPAFELGLIEKNDVLDVFVGSGIGRYVRLLIGAALWALVTALLVQLFVEGGRSYLARRRVQRASAARASARGPYRRTADST